MTWSERKRERPVPDGRSQLERMRAEDWFCFLTETELLALQEETMGPLRRINESYWDDPLAAAQAVKELLGIEGEFVFRPPFVVEYRERVHIGSGCFVNADFEVIGAGAVWIGDKVLIGPHARFYTPNHPVDPELRAQGWEIGLPIRVGNRAWLGGSVTVCPGVSIGDDAVVGAGSVVTKDVPAGAIVAGNPARVIGSSV